MTRHIKTRDWNMYNILTGHGVKAAVYPDARKQASLEACRGKNTNMFSAKKKKLHSIDWTRPAQYHGEELFEVYYDDGGEVVEVYLVDEEDNAVPFRVSAFNEQEMASIRNSISNHMEGSP